MAVASPAALQQEPAPKLPEAEDDRVVPLAFRLWSWTTGSLAVDLKRPFVPKDGDRTSLFTVKRRPPPPPHQPRYGAPQYTPNNRPRAPVRQLSTSFSDVAFSNTGARIKALRHLAFGPRASFPKGWAPAKEAPCCDLAAGLSIDLDTARVEGQLRLKVLGLVSLRALPEPALRVARRITLGDSGFGVRLSYECPLAGFDRPWAPPARLLVSIEDTVRRGLRLTQGGIEVNGEVETEGGGLRARASGLLAFPAELPVEEGQELFGWRLHRLGVKARW